MAFLENPPFSIGNTSSKTYFVLFFMLVYWKSCTIVAWCFVFGGRAKETAYDLITRICAAIIGIPIVLVSLVAEEFGNFGW